MQVLASPLPRAVIDSIAEGEWWTRASWRGRTNARVDGIPLADVEAALRRVYPASICRRMTEQGFGFIAYGLFFGGGFVWNQQLLALGVDLCACPAALDDAMILSELRGAGWLGARVEVGVLAGLTREGLQPRRPARERDEAQHDFSVDIGAASFAIECKALRMGNFDGNAAMTTLLFENLIAEFGLVPPRHADFRVSQKFIDDMKRTPEQTFLAEVRPRLHEQLRGALRAETPDGAPRSVGAFGEVRVTPDDGGERNRRPWTIQGLEPSAERRISRVVRLLHDAADSLRSAPPEAHRIAFLWLGNYLSAPAAAQFIDDNVGESIVLGEHHVNLRANRLCVDTGLLASAPPDFAVDDKTSRPIGGLFFGAGPNAGARLPAALTRGLLRWRMTCEVDEPTSHGT